MTAIALTLLGLVIVAAVLWEVFDDLFHPADSSALSDWIGRTLDDLHDRDAIFAAFAADHAVERR